MSVYKYKQKQDHIFGKGHHSGRSINIFLEGNFPPNFTISTSTCIHLNLMIMIGHWFVNNDKRMSHIIFVDYEDNMMITMNHGQHCMGHYYHQILDLLKLPPVDKQGSCWDPTDKTAWPFLPLWRCPTSDHWFNGSGRYSSTYWKTSIFDMY